LAVKEQADQMPGLLADYWESAPIDVQYEFFGRYTGFQFRALHLLSKHSTA
jgi:hypothetical protein